MGLLDDAIRDHLDLKRRRGADPSEIAREEREALDPVFPDEPRPPALDEEPHALVADPAPPHGDPLVQASTDGAGVAPADAQIAALGEETAELDMQSVMGPADAGTAPPVPAAPPAARSAEDELIEWEAPQPPGELPPEPLPGQERMSFE